MILLILNAKLQQQSTIIVLHFKKNDGFCTYVCQSSQTAKLQMKDVDVRL